MATSPVALLARLERAGGAHGQNESAQGLFLVPRQIPSGQRKLSHTILPSTGLWLSHTKQRGPSQARVLPLHIPTEAVAPPPQTVAGNLPAIADGTSSLANEPAGFNSYLPLTLIRVSLGHSSVSITSLSLRLQDVNLGPPLGWPPSSQPPSEGCCLTVSQTLPSVGLKRRQEQISTLEEMDRYGFNLQTRSGLRVFPCCPHPP